MREILFRGKTKNRKDAAWIEGSLVRGISKYDGKPVVFIYGLDTEMDSRGWIGNYFGEEVIPETVGQWTGLVDKNGVKIFEGDVVDTPRWVVTYLANTNEGLHMNAGWYLQRDDFESWCELECIDDYKILGNHYDNPELLERNLEKRFKMWAENGKKIAIPDSNGETFDDRMAKIDITKELKILGFDE